MIIKALTVQDLIRNLEPGDDYRAGSCSSSLVRWDKAHATAYFTSRCAGSANSWDQMVQFIDYNFLVSEEDRELIESFADALELYPDLLQSDVKVFCGCPSFNWWGHKYNLFELDTGLEPAVSAPNIRDPGTVRMSCKHLISVYKHYF